MNIQTTLKRLPSVQGVKAVMTLFAVPALTHPLTIAQEDEDSEGVFELSPFVVEASEDQGYRASSTLAASRLKTELKDVGSAISVITEEFLEDVGATDNESLLTYATNTEVGGPNGNFSGVGNGTTPNEDFSSPNGNTRVRGLVAADGTRNYFISDLPWDGYNTSRVELQRGPNAILYGLGSPGGIINNSLDKATFTNEGKATFRLGSYGTRRYEVSLNREVLKDELAVRVALLDENEKFRQEEAWSNDDRYYFSMNYKPKFLQSDSMSTVLDANWEKGELDSNRPRTLTPIDRITPFFNDVGATANTDGTYSYPLYGGVGGYTGDPYEAWNQFANKEGKGEAMRNQILEDGSSALNANYIPYLGDFGANVGGLLMVFPDANSPQIGYSQDHELDTFGGLAPDGTIDGTIDGTEFGRLTGIDTYSQYAIKAQLPGWDSGQYRDVFLQDSSVFDFWNHLLDGPNKSEWSDFEAVNVSFQQTFFNNNVGYELALYDQSFNRGQEGLFGDPNNIAINIDTNSHLGDGSPNPNVGRPFISDASRSRNYLYGSDRESARLTAYAELDFRDFDNEGWLSRFLGRHIVTGMASEDRQTTESLNFDRWRIGSDIYDERLKAVFDSGDINDGDWTNIATGIYTTHYLGGSLLGSASASGAGIPGLTAVQNPSSGTYYSFDATWNAPAGIAAGDVWTKPDGSVSTQSENTDNYVGWVERTLPVVSALNGGKLVSPELLSAGSISEGEVKSEALIWQGYLLDGALVGTYGWRKDTDTSWQRNGSYREDLGDNSENRITNAVTRVFDPEHEDYNLNFTPTVESGQSRSYSVAMHINRFFGEKLPINVSLYYNESENFQPDAGRVDIYNNPLPSPFGNTVDRSILLATKDNRFSLRITSYETASNLTSTDTSLRSWVIGRTINLGLNFTNVYEYDLAPGKWGKDGIPANAAQSWRYDFPVGEEALEASAITDYRAMMEALPEGFLNGWSWTHDPRDSATVDGIPESGQVRTTAPEGLTYTQNAVSKGLEFEFVANPTKNWRISANASKTKVTRTDVGGRSMLDFIEFVDHWYNETDAGQMRMWSSSNPDATLLNYWNQNFRVNFGLIKLLEGTANPEVREWRFNLISNYRFTEGILKNVKVGGAYRWEDKSVIGYPLRETDLSYEFDLQNPYYDDSIDHVDLWVGYSKELNDKIDWSIQLNIKDAFAKKKLIPISTQPNGDWAAVRMSSTTSWQLTNTFSF
ncbi:TonB-dependent receptor plug domain-containing protein [Puniceicoccaceae bacterium K14]|nr:TonB-dependent receptor plug domain-containing protein [Puniceicoccaceae bacterium K14]